MAGSSVVNHGLINSDITRIDAPPLLSVETAELKKQGLNFRLSLQLKSESKPQPASEIGRNRLLMGNLEKS